MTIVLRTSKLNMPCFEILPKEFIFANALMESMPLTLQTVSCYHFLLIFYPFLWFFVFAYPIILFYGFDFQNLGVFIALIKYLNKKIILGVAENYLGKRFDRLDKFYKFHSSYVMKQGENLNMLEASLVNFNEV